MTKRFMIVSIIMALVLMSVNAFALDTGRGAALGSSVMFVKGYGNAYNCPGDLMLYTNSVMVDLGNYAGGAGVAANSRSFTLWATPSEGLGIIGLGITDIDYANAELAGIGYLPDVLGDWDAEKIAHKFDLYYGRDMENMGLGLRLTMGGDSYKAETVSAAGTTTNDQKASVFGVRLGFLYLLDGEKDGNTIEAAFAYNKGSATREVDTGDATTSTMDEITGGTEIHFDARMFYAIGDETFLVPILHFNTSDKSWESSMGGNLGTGNDVSGSNMSLAVGLNSEVADDVRIIAGLTLFGMDSETDEEKYPSGATTVNNVTTKTTTLPAWHLGTEFAVFDWMTARVGASKTSSTEEVEAETGVTGTITTTTVTNARNAWAMNLGIGIKIDNFSLDARVNDTALFNGGYLYNGYQAVEPIANTITLRYYFGD